MIIQETRIYLRYSVRGYNGTTPDGMTCFQPCVIHVMAESEAEALKKAAGLVKREDYTIIEAGEYIYDKQLDGHK